MAMAMTIVLFVSGGLGIGVAMVLQVIKNGDWWARLIIRTVVYLSVLCIISAPIPLAWAKMQLYGRIYFVLVGGGAFLGVWDSLRILLRNMGSVAHDTVLRDSDALVAEAHGILQSDLAAVDKADKLKQLFRKEG